MPCCFVLYLARGVEEIEMRNGNFGRTSIFGETVRGSEAY
jgi:hypothetical protein